MGDEALERGCADLVVGGHLHVQSGPTAVAGENGAVGYSYTTGTTGGAAYAIAVGAADPPTRRDHACSPTATAARSASSRSPSTPTATFTVGDLRRRSTRSPQRVAAQRR